MSLGFFRETESQEQNRKPEPVLVQKVHEARAQDLQLSSLETVEPREDIILHLPKIGSCFYTTMTTVLIAGGVSALWVMAVGTWYIKYYIECSQGVRDCEAVAV